LEVAELLVDSFNFSGWNESVLPNYEVITNVESFEGDSGIIVGISSVSNVGSSTTCLVFDLFVPLESYLRNTDLNVGVSTTGISGIQTGYRFVISETTVGNQNITLDSSNEVIGIGTLFIDNIYECIDYSIETVTIPGIGVTDITRVITSVDGYDGLTQDIFDERKVYGKFSWGKINVPFRRTPKDFTIDTSENLNIESYPIIRRKNSLRYDSYLP
jgi:tetrahydromethanopterin S-methyltransferase subunit F